MSDSFEWAPLPFPTCQGSSVNDIGVSAISNVSDQSELGGFSTDPPCTFSVPRWVRAGLSSASIPLDEVISMLNQPPDVLSSFLQSHHHQHTHFIDGSVLVIDTTLVTPFNWVRLYSSIELSVQCIGLLYNLPDLPALVAGDQHLYLDFSGALYQSNISKKDLKQFTGNSKASPIIEV